MAFSLHEALGSSYTDQASDAFICTSSYHNRHFVGSYFKPIIYELYRGPTNM